MVGCVQHIGKAMQGSTRCKIHENGKKPCRNDKGKRKPVVQRQAKARVKALKRKLGV